MKREWNWLRIIAGVVLIGLGALSLYDGLQDGDSGVRIALHVAVIVVGLFNVVVGYRESKRHPVDPTLG